MAASPVAEARAPTWLETARLVLRKPGAADAAAIFERFASDADVTRYLSWPRHASVADTRAFLALAAAQWEQAPAGPYLIESREAGVLLGSTGLACESADVAEVGYVLAKDAWGFGFATEALLALVHTAPAIGLTRLYAICHTAHAASARVLEKSGFRAEGVIRRHAEFPNLAPGTLQDVLRFGRDVR